MTDLDRSHDPARTSWVTSANGHRDFPIQNLPFGVIEGAGEEPEVVVAIGDMVLHLRSAVEAGWGSELSIDAITRIVFGPLNHLAAASPREWTLVRLALSDALSDPAWQERLTPALMPQDEVEMLLPLTIGDYTDFYASVHHATNVGSMFRPDNPLLPNYRWVPIGYHGRSSSLIVSGTELRRPSGQLQSDDAPPVFGPCKMLDYELELGLWVGAGNALGQPIPIATIRDHWIGVSLLNDWSARDLQRWEYQPLGPFLAKSFATSVSPWITTQEALIPFFCPAAAHQPRPLDYLWDEQDQREGALDLQLEVQLRTSSMTEAQTLSRSNSKDLFWTLGQMLTHHASNGCPMRTGDLLASGTISGESGESAGCLLELTWVGPGQPRRPIALNDGTTRIFLQDGDEVILQGWAQRPGFRSLGLGPCAGRATG